MSYASLQSFGGIEPWGRYAGETDEVYLWRATFNKANIRSIQDMQAIAEAIGRNQGLGFDLRGIAVDPVDDEKFTVDGALTTKNPVLITPGSSTPEDIAARVVASLASRFPEMAITNARFEQITDDEPKHPALDFWLYQPIIWDIPSGTVLPPSMETGKPTHAFARFEGLFRGKAEQGSALKKWPKDEPFKPPNGNGKPNGDETNIVAVVLVLAGAAAVGYLIYRETGKQGAAL